MRLERRAMRGADMFAGCMKGVVVDEVVNGASETDGRNGDGVRGL